MVPLATLDQLDAADVPAVITPAIEGRWRWIGTRTLRFEVVPGATDRLPAATEFTVEIPAGIESASGARLDDTVSWTFATPAPQVTRFVGQSDSMTLTPVFVAVFDQIVDPTAVLDTVTVRAGGDDVALRPATPDEIEADDAARQAVADTLDGRAIAFRAVGDLPVDSAVVVAIGPGTPSAEGPLTTVEPVSYSGRTFGRFDIRTSDCGYGSGCTPGMPFTIEMTNDDRRRHLRTRAGDGRARGARPARRRVRQRDPAVRRHRRQHRVHRHARRRPQRQVRSDRWARRAACSSTSGPRNRCCWVCSATGSPSTRSRRPRRCRSRPSTTIGCRSPPGRSPRPTSLRSAPSSSGRTPTPSHGLRTGRWCSTRRSTSRPSTTSRSRRWSTCRRRSPWPAPSSWCASSPPRSTHPTTSCTGTTGPRSPGCSAPRSPSMRCTTATSCWSGRPIC